MTMERISRDYPNMSNTYLLDLLGKFLDHFKETGDPTVLRVSALRHGDQSLLTMLSAFVPPEEVQRCNYFTMTPTQLEKLSVHRMLIAREMGAKVLKKSEMPTSLSTFYRELVTISGHRNPVYSVAFDKTNRRLFTGSDDFLVKVWCVRTGHLIHTIRGHQNVITDIAINQENTLIATASSDGSIRVWTMNKYEPIICLRPNANTIKPFTTVKFSPSPKEETRYLMATNEDGFVRLWKWDRETLQFFDIDSPITFSCRFRAKDRLRCSSFNYTGTKFTVAGDDGFVYVFSTIPVKTTHEGVTSQGSSHTDYSSQERPTGRGRKRFANALFPDKNNPLNNQSVVPIGTLEGHMGSVTDLEYSHDGQRILSGCQDGTARVWKFEEQTKEWTSIILDLKETVPNALLVKPSTPNSTVMSRSTSYNFNQTSRSSFSPMQDTHEEEFGTLMPSLEHPFAQPSSMSIDPPVAAAQPTATLEPPKVSMIAWSADDRWCIVASNQGEIRVYYAYNGELACILKGHEGEIYALDNHPLEPGTILSAGYDGNVILWDIQKKKVINCTNHSGRTFTDCKFSKDGMKYAITDEEGHCTLFGIGGLDKDYELVRSWERGQYFITDYQALRYFADGSFLDEATQLQPYLSSPSPIIDLQGVAYPNQKRLGYGTDIPCPPETFELEDMKRSACYDKEEEDLRTTKLIVLPALDRATVAKRRREFVRMDDDDEGDLATANNSFQFPPPVFPILLPDDSADEDYHDDDVNNAAYATSGGSSDEEGGSDEFVTRDGEVEMASDGEADEDGPVTRSRAGQLGMHTVNTHTSRERTNSTRRRGRGRGRGGSGLRGRGRNTRKRAREVSEDDEEEEQPVRARARRRVTEIPSYVESDLESEEEFVDIESDHSEAGPSKSAQHNDTASTSRQATRTEPEDRKGKRKLRSSTNNDSDDDFVSPTVTYQHHNNGASSSTTAIASSSSAPVGRTTRSRVYQAEVAAAPSLPVSTPKVSKTSHKRGKQRDAPRELSEEEIKEHEPIPWITNTQRSPAKYLPQLHDIVVISTEGHKQYLKSSDMRHFFDERHGVINRHEPILFARVMSITWQVGPPAFCKLKLSMLSLTNIHETFARRAEPMFVPLGHDEILEYSDEDGCPEFIVLWERFFASMDVFLTVQVGQKVDAMYDEGKYTGTVSNVNHSGMLWAQANLPSPWAYYHVIWDDSSSSPEDLCPWEIVPSGEDFNARYDVSGRLSPEQKKRAKDVLAWLSNMDDFLLYVHQVNYYDYPAYLSVIAYPICLDLVKARLNNDFYRSLDALIDDVELIKKNAMRYNAESSPAHKNAIRLANFFKTRMQKPSMPLSSKKGGRKRAIVDESDDEYDEAQVYESEEEEEPILKKSSRGDRRRSDDEDDFINDDEEDYEDDYYDE